MSDLPLNVTPTSDKPDPNVVVPKSVRDAAARAEAHYQKPVETPAPVEPAPPPAPVEPAPPVAAAPERVPEPYEDTSPATDAARERSRYNAMRGRYDQAQKTIGSMQEQMAQLGDELLRTQAMIKQPRAAHQSDAMPTRADLITAEDAQNYGPELIDFAQRAAIAAIAPKLTELEEQNKKLQQTVHKSQRASTTARLDAEVPNWREINKNPRWLQWLRLPDVYSSRLRQQLLNEASAAGDTARVISFFKGFLAEEHATGRVADPPVPSPTAEPAPARQAALDLSTLASPGRPRPASGTDLAPAAADKPIITRADISGFYANVRSGAYRGQDALKAQHERMIFEAQREGRVR